MGQVYKCAWYCPKCKKYFKYISGQVKESCSKCDNNFSVEMVEQGSKNDPDVEKSRVKWITENERWSTAAGVPPSQVEEFRKRFPDSTYRDDGRLLIKNRKHKLYEMKRRGMIELD